MTDAGETSTAVYGGERERGVGGKFRREKKPPSTPYDRPPRGRWISRIVDPAKRLFYGLPSLFSPYPSSNLDDEVQLEEEQDAGDAEENCSLDILHSKVADAEQERKTTPRTGLDVVERAETSRERQKTSGSEEGELNRFQLATSTPLPQPIMQGGVGASPVDIARAYMGSRTSEMSITSTSWVPKTEKFGSTSEFPSKPIMPSPLPKAPIYWPGAVTQNQLDYSTPQSRNHRVGLHSFSRTPYSRTIFSKSKSKLTPLRGENERFPSNTPAPSQPTATPAYGSSYGSGGPLRRMRNRFSSATPARKATMLSTAERSPWAREHHVDYMPKKIYEPGSSSNTNQSTNSNAASPEAGVHNVHPHSSKLARQILEQLDRPITLKEKSNELKLAASWKNSSAAPVQNMKSPSTAGTVAGKSNTFNGVKLLLRQMGRVMVWRRKESIPSFLVETIYLVLNGPSPNLEKPNSQRSPPKGVNNDLPKASLLFGDPTKSAQRKPILPSIAIEKSGMRTSFASVTSPSFTFPFSTPYTTIAEPPTPSIMPSFSTSSPQQTKVSPNVPMCTSGNKITIAPAFPSSSVTVTPKDASALNFKFGSGKPRLSFAVTEDDAVATPSDNAIPKYKFGSDNSRLNFSLGSDALCY
ncbi:Nuclear pore complex protein NUP1 [Bienertia sinuspersici]